MRRVMLGLMSMIALIGLLIFSLELVMFDRSFYVNEYQKLDTANDIGISDDDLMDATTQLLAYIKADRPDLSMRYVIQGDERQLFNQREIDHMVDVRDLYLLARNVRRIGMAIMAIIFGYIAAPVITQLRKQNKENTILRNRQYGVINAFISNEQSKLRIRAVSQSMLDGVIVIGLVIAGIVAFYLIDFQSFWTAFHELVFSNDLWLLDPRTDILIQMVPTPFFIDIVGRIIINIVVVLTMVLVLSGLGLRLRSKQQA